MNSEWTISVLLPGPRHNWAPVEMSLMALAHVISVNNTDNNAIDWFLAEMVLIWVMVLKLIPVTFLGVAALGLRSCKNVGGGECIEWQWIINSLIIDGQSYGCNIHMAGIWEVIWWHIHGSIKFWARLIIQFTSRESPSMRWRIQHVEAVYL